MVHTVSIPGDVSLASSIFSLCDRSRSHSSCCNTVTCIYRSHASTGTPVELNGRGQLNGHHQTEAPGHSAVTGHAMATDHDAAAPAASTTEVTCSGASREPLTPPVSPPRLVDAVGRMKELGRDRRWRDAISVLRELQKDAEADPSLTPDLKVYNAAISAVAKSGMWDEVCFFLFLVFCFFSCCLLFVVLRRGYIFFSARFVCGSFFVGWRRRRRREREAVKNGREFLGLFPGFCWAA